MLFPEVVINTIIITLVSTSSLDKAYRGGKQDERYTSLFDLEWDKVPSWTEYNALISITPSVDDPKWRVDIYGQNITDEKNIMNIGEATAPLGFNKNIWAREQATYGVRWTYNF